MIATLDNFTNSAPLQQDPAQEHSVPLDANRPTILNFPLVRQMIAAAFEKSDKVVLLLTSNGSPEKAATEYYLRRVIQ